MPRLPHTLPARLDIRLTADQRQVIDDAADTAGQALSDWCRAALLRAARAELRAANGGKTGGREKSTSP